MGTERGSCDGRAYLPAKCSECGYDLSGADLSKLPVRCPECNEINPIFERDGKRYNWRGPSSKIDSGFSRATDALDLEGWDDFVGSPFMRAVLGLMVFIFLVSCCLCVGAEADKYEDYYDDVWEAGR